MDLTQFHTNFNPDNKRFELILEGNTAFINYILNDKGVMYLTHTEVPEALEGKGIGNKIVREALSYIKENNYKLAPLCPFVAAFLKRHREYQSLLAEGFNIK